MSSPRMVPLSDQSCFQLISGLWKGKKAPFTPSAVLRSTNFRGDGLLDYSDIAKLDVETRQFEQRKLNAGDIIIERSGGGPKQPVGRVGYFDPPNKDNYCTSNFTTALRVTDKERFDPCFVSLYLQGLYESGATETLQRATTGIRNLDWAEYLSFEIPEYNLDDQRSYARLLGKVRNSYIVEQNLIDTSKDIKRATMRELFTRGLRGEKQKETEIGLVPESWDISTIGSVALNTQYGMSVRGQPSGAYPILRMNCQEDGKVHYRNLQFVDLDIKTFESFKLNTGDLLFNRTNSIELVGRMAIVESDRPAVFASYLVRLTIDGNLCLPAYLNYFMNWPVTQSEIKKLASRAVGQANINASKLRTVQFPLPPTLDEQREIFEILDAIDQKIDLHKRKRTVLEELFKSLLHKLMTGEIRVANLDLSALDIQEKERAMA